MPINRDARKAALLFIAGQDGSGTWEPPTGNYTIKLYDNEDAVLSGEGYAHATKAITGHFALTGSGANWTVRNAVAVRFPATGEATGDWVPIKFIRYFRAGEEVEEFMFELATAVTVTEGLYYEIAINDLILDDGSE